MPTLLLLRHAKSSWDSPSLDDYDRPLAKRGLKAAPRMGAEIASLGLKPDVILCSSAVRTRETLALVLPEIGGDPEVIYDDAIYLAAPETLLAKVRALPDTAKSVMVVGHNPGMEELAALLVKDGGKADRKDMAEKFPTCALAVINFEAPGWAAVAPGAGTLARFITPAQLS
jgi:phosphohistidine phosphatase